MRAHANIALLDVLGIAPQQAHALTDALVDWIDSDTQPGVHGAEDDRYLQAAAPQRTGATLLAGVSELRAIAGYTPQLIAQLQPYVCALPEGRLSPININTLRLDDAPVLVALTGGRWSCRPRDALSLHGRLEDGATSGCFSASRR